MSSVSEGSAPDAAAPSASNAARPQLALAASIDRAFERAKDEGRICLIPYVMAGYPDAASSQALALGLARAGADVIELGVPFSDPLADGVTIQHAGQVALQGGMRLSGVLALAEAIHRQVATPLVLMGYYNPLLAFGLEHFCEAAAAAGVAGLIVPDLPPEEAEPLLQAAQQSGLCLIFLVTPTSPPERIRRVAEAVHTQGSGFVYCVSLSGVTGARSDLPSHLQEFLARVRAQIRLPLAVGFGVSTPAHVAQLAQMADGAVVASKLINLLDQTPGPQGIAETLRYFEALRPAARRSAQ
ncbi:MAG TPA: tryptophan synthase subunit alpha [Ktedonobacterales bacterium]|jgi:tryptophan synthase alpha chain